MKFKCSYIVLAMFAAVTFVNSAEAQLTEVLDHSKVVGAGFFQDNDVDKDVKSTLDEEFKKLDLRLRELENDVADKLKAAKESDGESDSEDLEERLAKLEKSFEKSNDAIADNKDAFKGYLRVGHGASRKMTFFGRIHLDYWAFPKADLAIESLEGENPQDRFNFRRLRIGVKGDLPNNVFYKYEGEFAGGSEPSYRDAIIGIRDLPYLNTMIVGNHKRPYGLDHLNSSRTNVFIERPFIIEAFNQDARRLGISSNGNTDNMNWRFGVWNQELTQTGSGYVGDHYQLELAGRIAGTPWYDETSGGRGYLHLGLSASLGYPDGLGTNNQARYRTRPEARSNARWLDTGRIFGADENMLGGLEAVLNLGALQLTAEYMGSNVERLDGVGPSLQFHGGYLHAAYFLTGEHTPWNRKTGTIGRTKPFENFFSVRNCDGCTQRGLGAWQVAVRYSYADFNDDDIVGGVGTSTTWAMNWWWNPYTRIQFNYINGNVDQSDFGTGDYDIVGMRFMVDF
jgi:phosphate-selective porin OprO/OprP